MGREGSYPHHSAPYKVCLLQEFFTGSSSYTVGSIRPKTLAGGILSFVLLYFAGVQAVAKPKKETADRQNDLLFLLVEMRGIEPLTS